jgi:signal transduction histidine kinase
VPSIATPLLTLLEAVLAWREDPIADRRDRAVESLAAAITAIGARGARLAADGLPDPDGTLATGTLATGAVGEGVTLYADDGTTRTATLWLDGLVSNDDGRPVARALELALAAAWSRDEVRQTADRLEALDTATRGIAGILSVERVLQLIVDRVRELIGAQYAALGIVDAFGVIERFVTSGITREERERIGPPPRGHGLLGLIVTENRALRVADIGHHPDSYGFPPNHPPMTSLLGVPIRVKGRSVGNFYLTNKRAAAEFSAADQQLVEMFALHAGIAIENARLHEQVQQLAVVDERVRIGKDLHDGIIQALYGISLSLEDVPDLMADEPGEATARVDRAIDSLNVAIRDIRNFIVGLRPELVEQGDLAVGLAALANELRLNTVIDVEMNAADRLPALDPDMRAEALQVAREALSNVARHSRATRVRLDVAGDDGTVTISVADNGRGFDPAALPAGDHQGLANMRMRAARLGGELAITSDGATGTRVELRFPVAVQAGREA